MRTLTVLGPQSSSLRAAMILRRARGLSSTATESSRSRNTTSAAQALAFSIILGLEAGTASSERCKRAVAGSYEVKLNGIRPRLDPALPQAGCRLRVPVALNQSAQIAK